MRSRNHLLALSLFFSAQAFSAGIPVFDAVQNTESINQWMQKLQQWEPHSWPASRPEYGMIQMSYALCAALSAYLRLMMHSRTLTAGGCLTAGTAL